MYVDDPQDGRAQRRIFVKGWKSIGEVIDIDSPEPPRCWVRHGLAKAGRIMVQIEGANPPMSTETNCESFGMSGILR